MSTRRLEREVERSKSVLYKAKGGMRGGLYDEEGGGGGGGKVTGGGYKGSTPMGAVEMEDENRRAENQLSPEQLQLFEKENDDMLRHYEDTLDKVRYVVLFPSAFLRPPPSPFTSLHTSFFSFLLITPSARSNAPSSKSPPCQQHSTPTSPRSKSALINWSATPSSRPRTWAAGTRS